MECPFCKIVKKEANAHIVCETENLIALLDIDPINEGHILVIPKSHEASIDNITTCVLTEIMKLLQKIVAALKEIYNTDGYSIMQNGGEFCDFGHAHFHVFPRYKNDGFGWKYPEGSFECSAQIAERLRNKIQGDCNIGK